MTPLGKSLVFYLKYMAEMERLYGEPELYGGEEPDLTGLDNPDHVREMARTVGAAAGEKAADFLDLCAKRIEDHFNGLGIATLEQKRKRSYVLRKWEWGTRVYVASVPGSWFSCGAFVCDPSAVRISVEKDVCGIVVPFLWSRGGRKGANAIWKSLGSWPAARAGAGEALDSGTVALACIPIKPHPPESLDVDRDLLIAEVTKTIGRIGAEQTKAIASLVAGLKMSDKG